jgi:hypothetical protein
MAHAPCTLGVSHAPSVARIEMVELGITSQGLMHASRPWQSY